jgi:hypothetical protein
VVNGDDRRQFFSAAFSLLKPCQQPENIFHFLGHQEQNAMSLRAAVNQ